MSIDDCRPSNHDSSSDRKNRLLVIAHTRNECDHASDEQTDDALNCECRALKQDGRETVVAEAAKAEEKEE